MSNDKAAKEMRDKIRAATVGAKKTFNKELIEYQGVLLEVRQLSLSGRRDYMTSSIDGKTKDVDLLKLQVKGIISSCYVPDTDLLIFEDTDYDGLCTSVTGGYADVIWNAVQRLSNFSVEDAKKN